ncbi:hypothetical protein CEXT_307611 [Caerostris extrusa]|uniref:Uncharacterized protein n=1 Tax=Caerostris extrusa TaxID=172846 RepID=A0AAV4S0H4_CAEEX|nr:hypothetical protein CEXT_307611 [Caerostris extrusa]
MIDTLRLLALSREISATYWYLLLSRPSDRKGYFYSILDLIYPSRLATPVNAREASIVSFTRLSTHRMRHGKFMFPNADTGYLPDFISWIMSSLCK